MLLAWHLKILAYRYDKVSRVSPIFYLESAIALAVDIAIFKVKFSVLQIIGLALVISVFGVIVFSAYLVGDDE